MNKRRVTLRDIAERAKLSRAAVSFALRNHPRMPQSTIDRVQIIARELGYAPDPDVSKLMAHVRGNQSTPYRATIAWLTAWPTEEGWHPYRKNLRIFDGAQRRAESLGYLLEPFWLRAEGMTGKRAVSILQARGVEAAIVAPLPDGMTTIDFEWSAFSIAAIGHSLEDPDIHRVESAHADNFELALQKIRERGVTRIGFVETDGTDSRVAHAWTGAFLADQQNLPRQHRVPLLKKPRIREQDFAAWFARHAPQVIISNECPILEWLSGIGLEVPGDVGHVRLDCAAPELAGRYKMRASDTWFSGIDQMAEEVGVSAVDLVVGQLHMRETGVPSHPRMALVKGRWLDLDTFAPEKKRTRAKSKRKSA